MLQNVLHSAAAIEANLDIQYDEKNYGLKVVPAVYDIASGRVEFLNR